MMRYAILAYCFRDLSFSRFGLLLYLLGLSFQPEEAPGFLECYSGLFWFVS
jgi:hypothetical protein